MDKYDITSKENGEELVGDVKAVLESQSAPKAPKDGIKTSSFYITILTTIIGFVLTFAVSKGWVTESSVVGIREGLIGLIMVIVGFVNVRYINSRTEVSKAKVEASTPKPMPEMILGQTAELAPLESRSLMGGGIFDMFKGGFKLNSLATMIDLALVFLGTPKAKSKKAALVKSLKATSAAIRAYKSSGEDEEDDG